MNYYPIALNLSISVDPVDNKRILVGPTDNDSALYVSRHKELFDSIISDLSKHFIRHVLNESTLHLLAGSLYSYMEDLCRTGKLTYDKLNITVGELLLFNDNEVEDRKTSPPPADTDYDQLIDTNEDMISINRQDYFNMIKVIDAAKEWSNVVDVLVNQDIVTSNLLDAIRNLEQKV